MRYAVKGKCKFCDNVSIGEVECKETGKTARLCLQHMQNLAGWASFYGIGNLFRNPNKPASELARFF